MKLLIVGMGLTIAMRLPALADQSTTDSISQFRVGVGNGDVVYSETLERAVLAHANDMPKQDYFSRDNPKGAQLLD